MDTMSLPVYDTAGQKISEVRLPETISQVSISVPVLHEVVAAYRNNRRQGTASTKTRAEVRGGGAKPWRQKGTGRARVGTIRSPLWRKGGVVFGPKPRSYRQDLPKKKIKLALKMAIKSKCVDNELMVIKDFTIDVPKTKKICQILNKLNLNNDKRVLVILENVDNNLKLASRNLDNLEVQNINSINTYEILNAHKVIFTESAFKKILKL